MKRSSVFRQIMITAVCLAFALFPAIAPGSGIPTDSKITELETIVVDGEGMPLAGQPRSATEGVVLEEQLEQRPVSRPAELLEFVPGLVATQHSGEGKANQYFLRGFNLDHGTDFAIELDGLPVNMRSHAHGQGYADVNFLIPELLRSLQYRKGLLYANAGDFATAGSAEFHYASRLPEPVVELTVGEFNYQHVFAGGSSALGTGDFLVGGSATRYDGAWLLDQNLEKFNGLLKYSDGTPSRNWSATAMLYRGEWTASDQIPQRAVDDGRIDEFGFVDGSDGGESQRYSLSWDFTASDGPNEWQTSAYVIDYQLDLFSNFTYFLDDPVNGDQFEQFDDRTVYGFDISHSFPLTSLTSETQFRWGVQFRHDDIDTVGLYRTVQRERRSTIREDIVAETSLGVFAELGQRWSEHVRSVLGARVDGYRFDVDAQRELNSGVANDALISPKLSLVFGPWQETEYFFGVGRGFHSNDARGAVIQVDPVDGSTMQPVEPLVPAWGIDVGLRTAALPRTQLAASVFALRLDSELVFVGDAGGTEASGESERYGIEIGGIHLPTDWLVLHADVAWTRARLSQSGNAGRIPNAVETVASFGATIDDLGAWSGGLRIRYLGDAPLVEDNSVRSTSTTVVNAQVGYRLNDHWSLALAAFNLLDSRDNDVTYYYTSRLPGESRIGMEDVHSHPLEPRHIRMTVRITL